MIKKLIKLLIKIFLALAIVLELLVIFNNSKRPTTSPEYIIVPGARCKNNEPMLALKYRLDSAYEYYTINGGAKNGGAKIITTGAESQGETISEAMIAKNYLVSLGVNESDIITEENSKNTIENLEFASDIAGKDKNYLIVSNGFHMFRLDLISKYIGIKHELYSAKTPQDILVKNYLQEVASIFYLAFKIVTGKV